jgi:hypothetical protein
VSIKEEVKIEITRIDELLALYKDLFVKVRTEKPNKIEVPALASIVQSFYTGVENILKRIAKKENISIEDKSSWHKELLKGLSEKGIISSELWLDYLDEFRAIRHVFIHNYSHFYDWEEMKDVVLKTEMTWKRVKKEIQNYLNGLNDK